MDETAVGDLIERVYDMALDPDLWPALVSNIAGAFGAHAGALEQEDMETTRGGGFWVGADPADLTRYFQYYASRNVLRRIDNVRERMQAFTPVITVDQQFLTKSQLMETEFYVDFLKPAGLHSVMTVGLWHQGVSFTGLDLFRGPTQPQFSDEDLAVAQALHPHLMRAFRLGRRFLETRHMNTALAVAVDDSPSGVLVLDAEGRIVHANPAAERLLTDPGGLTVSAGRLTAQDPASASRLGALVTAAASRGGPVGGTAQIGRSAGRAPLVVSAAPVGPERLSPFSARPAVVLFVTDQEAAVSEGQLLARYGLTPAQARVTRALVEGRSPRETAEQLGVSFFTVRAHLAQIYAKTGVGRQAELVALVTRGLPGRRQS